VKVTGVADSGLLNDSSQRKPHSSASYIAPHTISRRYRPRRDSGARSHALGRVCHTGTVHVPQGSLFGVPVPSGFDYVSEFLSSDQEASLLDAIHSVQFSTFEMRGVVARRRVAFFGRAYDSNTPFTSELPPFLLPLRLKLAEWAHVAPAAFAMALINEYSPGAPIGWHRDAPQYAIVAGVSLLSACRMKLRPYVSPGTRAPAPGSRRGATHEIVLERRSAYLMTGDARSAYEHHIPGVQALRYSITFRTLRAGAGKN
jgi:alkylated DNA repair dioxygenase AlkB